MKGRCMLTHPHQDLIRLDILYNDNEDLPQDSELNTILCVVLISRVLSPNVHSRHGKPRRSWRRPTSHCISHSHL